MSTVEDRVEVASPLADALVAWAGEQPAAVAIVGPDGSERTFAELAATLAGGWAGLPAAGVETGDLVLVVAEHDTDLVLGALTAMWGGVAAPVPAAQPDDYIRRAVADLAPRAVLCPPAQQARVEAVASGVPVVTLGETGATRPTAPPAPPARTVDGPVLVLPTTGSTGRPKWVVLSHRNLVASARVLERVHDLGRQDRALSLSPAGHALGLRTVTDALLLGGSAIVGASAVASVEGAADALVSGAPTWVVGPPGVLDAVTASLERTERQPPPSLRLVRSGAATLTPPVRARIERRLGMPLVAGYAMTEVGKIALQPLEPVAHKDHTVGRPNVELRVIGDDGEPVAAGELGRICVRGELVCVGYWGDDAPPVDADGWFDTGDLGHLDSDGFLTVAGRIDDTINRGGELIDPVAVEAALLLDPTVEQCLVAGVPHPALGEAVAALLVGRPGESQPSLDDLWRSAAAGVRLTHLPAFVVWVEELPRSATGKPDRRTAAEILARSSGVAAPPRLTTFDTLPSARAAAGDVADAWIELLDLDRSPRDEDDFLHEGGDSLLALELGIRLSALAGTSLSSAVVVEHRTFGEQVRLVASHRLGEPMGSPGLLRLNSPSGAAARRTPIVLVPGLDSTNLSMVRIIDHLGDRRPVYGLEATDDEVGADELVGVEALADRHERVLGEADLHDVHLVGYSFGALVAVEVAHRLEQAGRPARSLVIVDTMAPEVRDGFRYYPTLWSHAAHRVWGLQRRWQTVAASAEAARRGSGVVDRARRFGKRIQDVPGGWLPGGSIDQSPAEVARRAVYDAREADAQQYDPPVLGGPTVVISSSLRAQQCGDPVLGWDRRMPVAQVHQVRASHRSLRYWRARPLARALHRALDHLE